jgi:hypothetical protein
MPNCLARNDPGAELTTWDNRSDATEMPFVSTFHRRRAGDILPVRTNLLRSKERD